MSNTWNVRCEDGSGDRFEVAEYVDPVDGRYSILVVRREAGTDKIKGAGLRLVEGEGAMLALMLLEASRALGDRKEKGDRARTLAEQRKRAESGIAHVGEPNRQSHTNESADDEGLGRKRRRTRKGVKFGSTSETGAIVSGELANGTGHAWFRLLGEFVAGESVLVMTCRICTKLTLTKSTRETPCSGCGAPGTSFAGVMVDPPSEKAEADGTV